jgi:hypothetical protein
MVPLFVLILIAAVLKSGAVWTCHARAHARKSLMPVWRASSGLNSMPLVGNCTGNVRLLRASPSRWATRTVLSAWLKKHQTTNLGVGGSNPSGRASLRDIPCESHGIHTATVPRMIAEPSESR